jgi:hypothetical protein
MTSFARASSSSASSQLSSLTRIQLQQLAKENGIKANIKSVEIEMELQKKGISLEFKKGLGLRKEDSENQKPLTKIVQSFIGNGIGENAPPSTLLIKPMTTRLFNSNIVTIVKPTSTKKIEFPRNASFDAFVRTKRGEQVFNIVKALESVEKNYAIQKHLMSTISLFKEECRLNI